MESIKTCVHPRLTSLIQYILRKAFDCSPDGKVRTAVAHALFTPTHPPLPSVQPYLPRSILWRQKEQFSDGVGYSWIDGYVPPLRHAPHSSPPPPRTCCSRARRPSRIKDHAAAVVSDDACEKRTERWPTDTPDTKEAYFIREVFDGRCLSLLPRSPSVYR